jgi:hypothetical protein
VQRLLQATPEYSNIESPIHNLDTIPWKPVFWRFLPFLPSLLSPVRDPRLVSFSLPLNFISCAWILMAQSSMRQI